jgi:hypothetical protein
LPSNTAARQASLCYEFELEPFAEVTVADACTSLSPGELEIVPEHHLITKEEISLEAHRESKLADIDFSPEDDLLFVDLCTDMRYAEQWLAEDD